MKEDGGSRRRRRGVKVEEDWRERLEKKVERLENMLETMVGVLAEIGLHINELAVVIHDLHPSLETDTDSRDE